MVDSFRISLGGVAKEMFPLRVRMPSDTIYSIFTVASKISSQLVI